MTSEEEAEKALNVAVSKFGGLDVLVNCAGIGVAIATYAAGKKNVHPQLAFDQVLKVRLVKFILKYNHALTSSIC